MSFDFDESHVGKLSIAPSLWWRVHHEQFGATAFNASAAGDARFSPITRPDGTVIPTLYAGSTPEVAFMETVLHDVPTPSYGVTISLPGAAQEKRRMSCIAQLGTLILGDLRAIGLRRVGLSRSGLIDSGSSVYRQTRNVAERVYAANPELDGLVWHSRQEDGGKAVVLFEDRLIAHGHRLVAWHDRIDFNAEDVFTECLLDVLQALGVDAVFG